MCLLHLFEACSPCNDLATEGEEQSGLVRLVRLARSDARGVGGAPEGHSTGAVGFMVWFFFNEKKRYSVTEGDHSL